MDEGFQAYQAQNWAVSATPKDCPNGVFLTVHHSFRYIGVSVTRTFCAPAGLEALLVITRDDATGQVVDMDGLDAADRAAFHGWHASIDPELRIGLEQQPNEPQEVYVWFCVDERDAPDKEWLVGEPAAAAQAAANRESRMRSGAAALWKKLAAMSGVELTGNPSPPVEYGIPVVRVKAKLTELETIGGWPEVWRIDRVPTEYMEATDNYYYTTVESGLDYWFGYDGTGITVATYEGDIPNSWVNLSGTVGGSCLDDFNNARKCHCSAGSKGAHSRLTMGMVRRNTGILGMANDATTIMANHSGGCTTHGTDNYASALNWATANGARVISHSACTGTGSDQNAHDRFFDYKASVSPWPFIPAATWNNPASIVCNKLRNGVVVGGGDESQDATDRSLVVYGDTSYLNGTSGYDGHELPHLVAISDNVTSAGYSYLATEVTGGSSMSTPEVAGIAASLQEGNSVLQSWPELMVPGLMASANEDVEPGVVLSLHDTVDDKDGAGLVNAWEAWRILRPSAKVDGSNPAAREGHDYGTMNYLSPPSGTYYWESYNALVPPGAQVRIVSFLQARPTCPQNPGSSDCSADPYPKHGLFIYDGGTLAGWSINGNNNYQYIAKTNSSGVTKTYTIRIYLDSWSSLSSTTWGLAWSSQ